ncbi:MAG: hypothetical protein LDL39_04190 [Magnetospirillum sp.]|nr:hypothetical protein [Magnetospirillum sp.]
MASSSICPSAAMLIQAINTARPELSEKTAALAKAHSDFIFAVSAFCARNRDMALASTNAEQAFAWALKGIADEALKRSGDDGSNSV